MLTKMAQGSGLEIRDPLWKREKLLVMLSSMIHLGF